MRTTHARTHAIATIASAMTLAITLTGCALLNGSSQQPSAHPTSDVSSREGITSTAVGTTGMEPIGTLAAVDTSAAVGLTQDPATDPAYARFYEQTPQWGECDNPKYSELECARITVPLAWDTPDGDTIELAITRLPAGDTARGSLLINPGGPGGSGNSFLANAGERVISAPVRAEYDIIGFDPRGVRDSSPVTCLDGADTDTYRAEDFPDTDEGEAQAEESYLRFIDACVANSGDILQYLDTFSAARDMDVIRAAVDSDTLDYLGFSYGTFLGATYADLYPQRTGHLILDGAVDPSLTADEISAGQAQGFERAADAFVTWCQNERPAGCPLTGTVDEGKAALLAIINDATDNPLPTKSGRDVTTPIALSGVLTPLYSDENWEYLVLALEMALQGRGDLLLLFADLSADRLDDGTYESNGLFAIRAINCLDRQGVIDEEWVERESERLTTQFPTFGEFLGGGGVACDPWPATGVRAPTEIKAAGSSTIVVIGTTGDPATPYEWSESLHGQLENSVLLTFEGNRHTAYSSSGGCIEEAVDNYLLHDTVPEDGLRCSAGN